MPDAGRGETDGTNVQETDKNQLALKAANLYYMRGEKMETIAREFGGSRSTVSRLLKYARDTNLVEITLKLPTGGAETLAKSLGREYGTSATVVPVPAASTELERLELVAAEGARVLDTVYGANMLLGVAWGTTVAAVGRHLDHKATSGARIVQLNGAANPETTGLRYAADIIERFGRAYDATVQSFPVPAFFDYAATRSAMWRERSIGRILGMQRQADVCLFSLGAVAGGVPSHVYSAGYLDRHDFAALRREKVVGDLSTVFIRADGSHAGISLNERASGMPPEDLRRVNRRICVVTGRNKVPALRAALRSHLVTDLVIDEPTAADLMAPRE